MGRVVSCLQLRQGRWMVGMGRGWGGLGVGVGGVGGGGQGWGSGVGVGASSRCLDRSCLGFVVCRNGLVPPRTYRYGVWFP